MKIAYITDFDLASFQQGNWPKKQIGHWGHCYYIAKSLETDSTTVQYASPLISKKVIIPKIKRRLYSTLSQKVYHYWAEPIFSQDFAKQIHDKLSSFQPDIVFTSDPNLISYVKCKQPIVLWTDTIYAGLINFYPTYFNVCQESLRHLRTLDRLALNNCNLIILASEWAAQTVIDNYQIDPSKVKVVPHGANLECDRTVDDINTIIKSRPSDRCKLLFLGVDWIRKGGNVALEVVKSLNRAGLSAELNVVGVKPVSEEPLPDYVHSVGFIDKSKPEGLAKLNQLLAESHFLILPSRAECFGHVFCEANSFGVPCLATKVGGIPSVIRDNANGKTFALDTDIKEYCDYIISFMKNYEQYEKLALSSFKEYQTRLNWTVAGQTVNQLLRELIE
ncbi:glycosyltransferase family 4 protein [Roseofilum sp. BLCC_M91]|uniref:Glycosyltransferase family 4 protein n=1 Tax=Roseofilum halophilum BLCC-M91 TaxID=3022259 RepID=A0ABT7BI30_9CYAN|nr:glycosyltransferase family 4 protein [Roseofilum halophilum]MDJ1178841.1 glycosyltransferase family 4 protein [Roseofilum halophilum BLCC-M91]